MAERRLIGPLLAAVAILAGACGGSPLRVAPTTHHGEDEPFLIVPYPPPPAHAEVVPMKPAPPDDAVWVDGEWEWRGRRWVWRSGRWEIPKPGMAWAPATTVRLSDGSLAHFPGTWRPVGSDR